MIDEDLAALMISFEQRGVLEDSLVLIVGDHGPHRFSLLTLNLEGLLQLRLPALFMTVPRSLLKQYPHYATNLVANSQKPVTHYDLYWTLRQAAYPALLDKLPLCRPGAKQPRSLDLAQSLFSDMEPTLERELKDLSFQHLATTVCDLSSVYGGDVEEVWPLYSETSPDGTQSSKYQVYCDGNPET